MCRNITPLRGLEPGATRTEIEAAALQYVRKVGSLTSAAQAQTAPVQRAVATIAAATEALLAELPPRRQPPTLLPPLRRRALATQPPTSGVAPGMPASGAAAPVPAGPPATAPGRASTRPRPATRTSPSRPR